MTTASRGRAPRSFLFVPGCEPRKIEKARTLAADVILLDLEDAAPEAEKERGRQRVAEALAEGNWGGNRVGVRINAPSSPHADADLEAALAHPLDWLFVPKVEDTHDLELVTERLEAARVLETVSVAAILESAIGVLNAAAIAAADARLDALMFGSGDCSADLGIRESPDRNELDYPRSHLALAAANQRLLAIDTPFYQDIHNLDAGPTRCTASETARLPRERRDPSRTHSRHSRRISSRRGRGAVGASDRCPPERNREGPGGIACRRNVGRPTRRHSSTRRTRGCGDRYRNTRLRERRLGKGA